MCIRDSVKALGHADQTLAQGAEGLRRQTGRNLDRALPRPAPKAVPVRRERAQDGNLLELPGVLLRLAELGLDLRRLSLHRLGVGAGALGVELPGPRPLLD